MEQVRQALYNIYERYIRQKGSIVMGNCNLDDHLYTLPSKKTNSTILYHHSKKANGYDKHDTVKYRQLRENEEQLIDCSDDEITIYINPRWEDNISSHEKNGE